VRDQLEKHDSELQNRKRIFALPEADDQVQEKAQQDRPSMVNQVVDNVLNDDNSTGSSSDNKLDTGSNIQGKAEIIANVRISPQY